MCRQKKLTASGQAPKGTSLTPVPVMTQAHAPEERLGLRELFLLDEENAAVDRHVHLVPPRQRDVKLLLRGLPNLKHDERKSEHSLERCGALDHELSGRTRQVTLNPPSNICLRHGASCRVACAAPLHFGSAPGIERSRGPTRYIDA